MRINGKRYQIASANPSDLWGSIRVGVLGTMLSFSWSNAPPTSPCCLSKSNFKMSLADYFKITVSVPALKFSATVQNSDLFAGKKFNFLALQSDPNTLSTIIITPCSSFPFPLIWCLYYLSTCATGPERYKTDHWSVSWIWFILVSGQWPISRTPVDQKI